MNYKITSDLAELVGAYIGDGCIVRNGRSGLKFEVAGHAKLDGDYFVHLKKIIRRISDCEVKIKQKDNELRLIIYSKEFILTLVRTFDLPIGRKTEIT